MHTEIQRHHILALLLGYFGIIFVNAFRFFLGFSFIEDFPFHLLNMGLSLIYSLSLVLIKYLMINYVLLSPYFFLFYDGIFNIINSILLILLQYIIIINLPDQNKKVNDISEENDKYFSYNFLGIIKILIGQKSSFYIYFFLSFIFSFFYYIINTLVLYNNSPFLIILLEAFLPFDNDIIIILLGIDKEYVKGDDTKKKILKRFFFQAVGYTFLLFGSLILNEIIIFNCCGLNKNTFNYISKRSQSDLNCTSALEANNDDDDDISNCEEIQNEDEKIN